jgi:serine phosphatase RsbU (regulator of sigma subunit)
MAFWTVSLVAALPAAALAALGGVVGVHGLVGQILLGLSVVYLAGDVFLLQPRIDRGLAGMGPTLSSSARFFLQRALAVRSAADVVVELEAVTRHALGVERTLVILPADNGGVEILGAMDDEAQRLGDAELAFRWLGDVGEPMDRAELSRLDQPEAHATLELLTRLSGDAVLPLRHRGLLLGVAVLSEPARKGQAESQKRFYRALASHATVAIANTYLDREARGKKVLTRTFELATAVQEALMPEERTVKRAGTTIRGVYRPVAECGGDFWTYQDLGRGRLLLVIADATGHGAGPAMLTAVLKGAIDAARHVVGDAIDPGELLSLLNRAVFRAGHTRYLMTAFAAVIDSQECQLSFANAGQNFPYVLARTPEGKVRLESLVARGNALGAVPEAVFPGHTRKLSPGDRLVLYTDGIVEAGSPRHEPYGEKRFRAALSALSDVPMSKIPDTIVNEVESYLAGRPYVDDMTLVAAELLAADEASVPVVGARS